MIVYNQDLRLYNLSCVGNHALHDQVLLDGNVARSLGDPQGWHHPQGENFISNKCRHPMFNLMIGFEAGKFPPGGWQAETHRLRNCFSSDVGQDQRDDRQPDGHLQLHVA